MKILAIWITKGLFIFVICIAEWNVCSNLDRFYQKTFETTEEITTINVQKSDPYASILILVCNNSNNGAIFLSNTFGADVIKSNDKCSITFINTKNFTIQCSGYNKLFFISNGWFSVSI